VEDQTFFVVLFVVLFVVVFAVRFSETRAAARSAVCLSFDAAAFGVIFLAAIQILLLFQWPRVGPSSTREACHAGHERTVSPVTSVA
jgi:hypothetical protein